MQRFNLVSCVVACATVLLVAGCDQYDEASVYTDASSFDTNAGNDASSTDTGTADTGTPEDAGQSTKPECSSDFQCSDNNPCTENRCEDGKCYTKHVANGTKCDDGDVCTGYKGPSGVYDMCSGGVCTAASAVCNDNNPCTVDSCDKASQKCVYAPLNQGSCDDGNACTTGDLCKAGKCQSGNNSCECSEDTDCADDGNLCNGTLVCKAGKCAVKAGSVVTCEDNWLCKDVACNPSSGKCESTFDKKEDGLICSKPGQPLHVCSAGECVKKPVEVPKCTAASCDDGNPCTADKCFGDECLHSFTNGACSDGNLCTTDDSCYQGKCVGKETSCDDGNSCTVDACDMALGCTATNAANLTPCNDGNPSTLNEVCSSGFCKAKVECQSDWHCSDGNTCNGAEKCITGSCKAGKALDCDDGAACTVDSCDPKVGCKHKADDSKCSSGHCFSTSQWSSVASGCYACDPTSSYDGAGHCDDSNVCTSDSCYNGKCKHKAISSVWSSCSDDNPCTQFDSCEKGVCKGDAKDCDDNDPKTADSCDSKTGKCLHKAIPADTVEISIGATAASEPHIYWGKDMSDFGPAAAGGFHTFKIKLSEACEWGVEGGVRVAKSIDPTMPWYYCDAAAPADYSTVTVKVAGKVIQFTTVKHTWSCSPNIFISKTQLGCP